MSNNQDNRNLNPDDFEGYGSEIVDLVNQVNALKAENAQLKGTGERLQKVEEETAKITQDRMWEYLDDNMENWEKINKDPEFLKWLDEVDPLTGMQRQRLLDDAMATFDVERVAHFFTMWQGDTKSPLGPGPAGPTPTITKEQFLKAQKDVTTGRMTHEKFEKLADQYQRQLTTRRQN